MLLGLCARVVKLRIMDNRACHHVRTIFGILLPYFFVATSNHGLSGVPSAWRDWRSEEAVNPQAAGIYAVAVELMALHPPSDTSRVSHVASCLLECLRKV